MQVSKSFCGNAKRIKINSVLKVCLESRAFSLFQISLRGYLKKSKLSSISTNAAGLCVKKPWDPQRAPAALCLKILLVFAKYPSFSLFSDKSQSNFWLSFQKFLYAGIAYCYRLFRHFLLWKIFSNLLISPYVLVFKSSMWSSKFSVYYLCNQPLHFCYRRFGSRMRVIVQRHIDVGMSHDVLQCLWVHSCIC